MDDARTPAKYGTGVPLLLLCTVQFLDVLDASILNVALPSIQSDLEFSRQSLQWVVSGYVLAYGGFLLLGGRLADLFGRRRVMVAGVALFGVASAIGGAAQSSGVLVSARLLQGLGAALMAPAALSILTTSFAEGEARNKALGAWGAIAGLGAAAGVTFGGLLTDGPGWRWVLYVNLPVTIALLIAAYIVLPDDRRTPERGGVDAAGAVLVTTGMLALVYGLIDAPERGWTSGRVLGLFAAAAVLLVAFVVNETRTPRPLMPLDIFRIRGLAAANITQVAAMAGFFAMFFFLTLYMQNVLGWSPVRTGLSYLPVTVAIGLTAGLSGQLFPRIGTRPVIVGGAVLAAVGLFLLSGVPVDGTYVADVLPGIVLMALGMGAVFVGVTTAANAGVPADRAGLAAGLITTSVQLGGAVGLAVLSAVATGRIDSRLAAGADPAVALTDGIGRALLVGSLFLAAAALIALRLPNKKVDAAGHAVAPDGAEENSAPALV